MPYLNSYVCRLYDPKDYVKGTFRSKIVESQKDGRPIRVILAKRSSRGSMEVQSLRFPKSVWKSSEVKAICRDNYGLFEDVQKNSPKKNIHKFLKSERDELKKLWGFFKMSNTHNRMMFVTDSFVRRHSHILRSDIFYELERLIESKKLSQMKNPPKESRQTRKGKLPQGCVLIYDRLLAIEAVKSKGSNWPKEKFRHDFTRKGSKVYGLSNGDLLIRGKVPLHKQFEYDENETVRGGAR